MRPDVARAFDRMEAAARADGVRLIVTSAYRSDAEQAELYKRHPDPKWVAPPGKSLHRLGTELDLGPPSAYGWLANNARRFHFHQRYSWEWSELSTAAIQAIGGAGSGSAFPVAQWRSTMASTTSTRSTGSIQAEPASRTKSIGSTESGSPGGWNRTP
jgi:hypothetical protein